MRVGILGGSFDPPHIGHLLVGQDVSDTLTLDTLLIVPAGSQPLKPDCQTPAAQRLRMAQLCFADLPKAVIDSVEVDRGGLSYMVDTVETLHARWPAAELLLLVGQDVVATLPRWKDTARLFSMVQLVVLQRHLVVERDATDNVGSLPTGAVTVATRRVDVSSTEVRGRVRDGRSLAGFVTSAVASYIGSTGLYLQDAVAGGAIERA